MMLDKKEQRKIRRLNFTFAVLVPAVTLVSWWLWGVDFGKGALIGCIVVGVNLLISQKLVAKLIYNQASKSLALLAYFFKIGLSVLILYIAIAKLQADLLGIALGLSTIIIAILISSLGATPEEGEQQEN